MVLLKKVLVAKSITIYKKNKHIWVLKPGGLGLVLWSASLQIFQQNISASIQNRHTIHQTAVKTLNCNKIKIIQFEQNYCGTWQLNKIKNNMA